MQEISHGRYPCKDWDLVEKCGNLYIVIERKERDYLLKKLKEIGLSLPFPEREATNLDLIRILLGDYGNHIIKVGNKLVWKENPESSHQSES